MQADLTNATGNTVQKNVVGSFIRSEDGTVAVKKIIYDLSGNTVLFDDGGDLGILDRTFNVTPSSVTLDINTNGVTSKHTVLAYTIDALIADGATFEGNYANTATPAADYVKVQGVWVKAVDSTTVPGQEVAATSAGPVGWSVDTTPIPAGTTVEAPNSLDLVDITALTNEELDVMVQATDVALEAMISATADLGSIAMRIGMQEEFIAALTDSIDSGIGRLVDADMNEESTRLKALQTQQQLAIQSLSIANTASENILSLFRQ